MSTEVVAMHVEVYRARPQAGAVIRTHSRTRWRSPWRKWKPRLPGRSPPRLGQAEEVPVAPRRAPSSSGSRRDRHAGRPAGRPRGARLRPGHRVDGLAPGRAFEEAAEAELAHRRPRPVIRAARDIAHLGMAAGERVCHGGRIPGHQGR
jgi:L-fuculose-phosphate aldolase